MPYHSKLDGASEMIKAGFGKEKIVCNLEGMDWDAAAIAVAFRMFNFARLIVELHAQHYFKIKCLKFTRDISPASTKITQMSVNRVKR